MEALVVATPNITGAGESQSLVHITGFRTIIAGFAVLNKETGAFLINGVNGDA